MSARAFPDRRSFAAAKDRFLDIVSRTPGLPPLADRVAIRIARYANYEEDGWSWPSKPRLVAETGASESTVERTLKALQSADLIEVVVGRGQTNSRYRISRTVREGSPMTPLRSGEGSSMMARGVTGDASEGSPMTPDILEGYPVEIGEPSGLALSPTGGQLEDRTPDALERAGSSRIYVDPDEPPFDATDVQEASAEDMAERVVELEREEEILSALRGGRSHLKDGTKVVPPAPSGRASSMIEDDYRRAHWIGRFVTACSKRDGEDRKVFRDHELRALRDRLHREGRECDEINRVMAFLDDEAASEFRARIPFPTKDLAHVRR